MTFENIISSSLGPTPSPKHIYTFPIDGGKIHVSDEDKAAYHELFFKSPNKGVGNGEIAMYWLFSTGHNKPQENRNGSNADLIINDLNCEIKSYNSHHQKITLGKFKDSKEERLLINKLFSFYNLYHAINHKTFKSEIHFNYNDLVDCYKTIYDNRDYILLDTQHPELIKTFQDVYNTKSPEENAYDTFKQLIISKFMKKPGDQGYVINCLTKNPLDIHAHKVDFNSITPNYDVFSKNVLVASGEIKVSYKIFE